MCALYNENADGSDMRKPYLTSKDIFDVEHLKSREPVEQFRHWFDEAAATDGILEPNTMALATATKTGIPSVRIVLLKGFSREGFTFFSNYESRKAQELAENPNCSLLFFWDLLRRSVRIEGKVEKIPEEDSVEYFTSRPRPSQIGAIVSQQSQVIASREVLDKRNEELHKEYEDESKVIPKPSHWGGYLVRPKVVEFWQGQSNRLHDRIVFRRPEEGEKINPETTHVGDDGWVFERQSP